MKRLVRTALLLGTFTFLVWGASALGAAVNNIAEAKANAGAVGTIGVMSQVD